MATGTLVEPFYLIPIAWLFVFIALISGLIVFTISCVHKSKRV
ncbi:DUF3955 domain-containing protein [Clostridium sp.]